MMTCCMLLLPCCCHHPHYHNHCQYSPCPAAPLAQHTTQRACIMQHFYNTMTILPLADVSVQQHCGLSPTMRKRPALRKQSVGSAGKAAQRAPQRAPRKPPPPPPPAAATTATSTASAFPTAARAAATTNSNAAALPPPFPPPPPPLPPSPPIPPPPRHRPATTGPECDAPRHGERSEAAPRPHPPHRNSVCPPSIKPTAPFVARI
jgi:hypothetical protein